MAPRVTPSFLRSTLKRLNRDLCTQGRRDAAFAGMGTTVAGIGCGLSGLFAFHVGDSRVYRIDSSRLTQLTRDDSEAEDLIELGLLSADAEIRPGYLRKTGVPYSDQTRVEELFDRFTEPNSDNWLVVDSIVTDPVDLTRPYLTSVASKKIPDKQGWDPTPCRANEAR